MGAGILTARVASAPECPEAASPAASAEIAADRLKVETDCPSDCTRRNVVRSAEGGKKVVYGLFIGEIDDRQARAQLEFVASKQIVLPEGDIEETAGCDAGWVMVVVLGPGGGD